MPRFLERISPRNIWKSIKKKKPRSMEKQHNEAFLQDREKYANIASQILGVKRKHCI